MSAPRVAARAQRTRVSHLERAIFDASDSRKMKQMWKFQAIDGEDKVRSSYLYIPSEIVSVSHSTIVDIQIFPTNPILVFCFEINLLCVARLFLCIFL